MNRYIKIQFIKNGIPSGGTYVYKTSLDVQLGETVMVTEKVKGIVAGFVPPALIDKPEEVKEIFGQIPREDKPQPKTLEDLDDELCDYCPLPDELKGVHSYGGNPVMCEGSHCNEAYERYLEEFKQENGGISNEGTI